ncbi:MAG: hypothetical protein LBH76_01390 [Propionibacteriaceae bacterium]|nr:hypothetical protein [Propionibacteriaceae bacterium]
MSVPSYQAPPPTPSTVKKPGKAFLIVSLVIMLGLPVICVGVAVAMLQGAMSEASAVGSGFSNQVELKANSEYTLLSAGAAECQVTTPDGGLIMPQSSLTGVAAGNLTALRFTSRAAGQYEIVCATNGEDVVLFAGDFLRNSVIGAVLILIAIGLFVLGGILTIVAAVLRSKANRRFREARDADYAAQMSAQTYAPPYGQPPYGQGQPPAPPYGQTPPYGAPPGGQPPSQ